MLTGQLSWIEEAATLPLAFAQVREDPEIDRWIVDRLGPRASIAMIASGGCTAALLTTAPNLVRIHLIDANSAQLALTRLKLRLLQSASTPERLALLGHEPLSLEERTSRLKKEFQALGLSSEVLGPIEFVSRVGPDLAGRYERLFAALQGQLADHSVELEALLRLSDPSEQTRRIAPDTTLGRRLDEALDMEMALPVLVRLFGAEATNNPVMPFAHHFAARVRHAFATLPAADNPYLWQMLMGQYPPDVLAPWLHAESPMHLPEITYTAQPIRDALATERSCYDLVHLSNVLDWLTPEAARETLDVAAETLRPTGWIVIRQLNSTLDIRGLSPRFEWLDRESESLHEKDRSFFYRALHIGRLR